MQIAARSTIIVTFLFLLGLAGSALWLERDARDSSREAMAVTAELIATEISAALYNPIVDRVLERDDEAFVQLNEIVAATIDRSETVIGLEAISANGEHLAGGDDEKSYSTLKALFGDRPHTQVSSEYTSHFTIGRHIALVPISREGKPVAYLRIELSNRRIHDVYDQLIGRFASFALIGVAAIIVLGGLLHIELSRIGREIIGQVKAGPTKEPKKLLFGKDEFADLRHEVMLLGSESTTNVNALGALTQALKLGLVLFDATGRPRFVSNTGREMMGLAPDKDPAMAIKESLGNSLDELNQTLATLIAGKVQGKGKSITVHVRKDSEDTGSELEFEMSRTSNDSFPVLALIRDQKQVAALQRSLAAATRMHSLSSIFAGAAHDLRAPISAMVMNLELLEDTMSNNNGAITAEEREEQRRYVQILQEELNRLQRFLTSFLNSASMMRYKGQETIALKQIIDELVQLFRVQARHTGVSIETVVPESELWIEGSSDQIRQLFMNIIVNALEAMPDGGTLTLKAEQLDGKAIITFRDTGQGVPSTVVNELFDLHFTTKSHGTGIGLHVARTIASQHNGTIDVQSTLGEGTEFVVGLPAVDGPADSGNAA